MGELISPLGVKRGRPSKTAPVYDSNNNMLITSEERERINACVEDIKTASEKAESLIRTTARRYYDLGEILHSAEMRSTETMTAAKYEEMTGIPAWMVSNARKIYKKNEGEPEKLDNLSMREALALISDKKELPAGESAEPGKMVLPAPKMPDWSGDFSLPPVSGVKLDNYRLHTDRETGILYLLRKGSLVSVPVARLTPTQPLSSGTEAAYRTMMDEVQGALEAYYNAVESEEKYGK